MKNFGFLFLILILCCTIVRAQSVKQLENQKKNLQKEIVKLRKELGGLQNKTKYSKKEIKKLRESIYKKELSINSVNKKLKDLDYKLYKNKKTSTEFNQKEKKIKEELTQTIVGLYTLNGSNISLVYNFEGNEYDKIILLREWVKYYNEYKIQQLDYVKNKKLNVDSLQTVLTKEKTKIGQQLLTEKDNRRKLYNERVKVKGNLAKVSQQTKRKKQELDRKIIEQRKLQKLIKDLIQRKKENKKVGSKKDKADKIISGKFEKNKGHFPWPVKEGTIIQRFGNYYHGKVLLTNNGINIKTKPKIPVSTIFGGQISAVANIGGSTAVVIKHGDYFSVYSNLKNVRVKMGDQVKIYEQLGYPVTDEGNITFIHLEIWENNKPVDPQDWIIR